MDGTVPPIQAPSGTGKIYVTASPLIVEKPNELWMADTAFIPTLAGFLFLAVVMHFRQ